jgi:hypothetical protein
VPIGANKDLYSKKAFLLPYLNPWCKGKHLDPACDYFTHLRSTCLNMNDIIKLKGVIEKHFSKTELSKIGRQPTNVKACN